MAGNDLWKPSEPLMTEGTQMPSACMPVAVHIGIGGTECCVEPVVGRPAYVCLSSNKMLVALRR